MESLGYSPAPVLTKRGYYSRWMNGEFGNRPLAWSSIDALEKSGFSGKVNIRHVVPGSPHIRFGVPAGLCRKTVEETGLPADQFKFNELMPDDKILLQGEVCEDHRGWNLAYCTDRVTMRQAMANAQFCSGLKSRMMLRSVCDATSYEAIEYLLERYPEHTIEFSVFGCRVGDRKLNTIIWEVRRY